jgi:hypothetical protein
MEDAEEYQSASEEIVPIKQETILFYGKPLIGVILPDERPGVVLRSLCENLQLDRAGQIRRIRRTEAIADDLVSNVRIEYQDGPAQHAHVLVLHAVAYWLATVDVSRVREAARPDILHYQKKAVDALYTWAQSWRALPAPTSEAQVMLPTQEASREKQVRESDNFFIPAQMQEPGPEATHAQLATYHEHMALWHRWQADHHAQQWRSEVEEWRGSVESQLEGNREMLQLIPEVLERLGPQTVNTEHQTNIRGMVKRLEELSGTPYQTIYWELAQAFQAPRYTEILESQYDAVCQWFQRRIEAAKKPKRGKP